MQLKNKELSLVATSLIEVQQNAGKNLGSEFRKGLPIKLDYDCSKIIKHLVGLVQENTKGLIDHAEKQDLKIDLETGKVSYEGEGTDNDDETKKRIKTEFVSFMDSHMEESNEVHIKQWGIEEWDGIILNDCPNKNIFFKFLIKE